MPSLRTSCCTVRDCSFNSRDAENTRCVSIQGFETSLNFSTISVNLASANAYAFNKASQEMKAIRPNQTQRRYIKLCFSRSCSWIKELGWRDMSPEQQEMTPYDE